MLEDFYILISDLFSDTWGTTQNDCPIYTGDERGDFGMNEVDYRTAVHAWN